MARKYRCFPIDRMGDVLTLVIDNPLDEAAKKEIKEKSGLNIRCFIAVSADIIAAIDKHYGVKIPEHVDLEEAGGEGEKISTYKIRENGTVE